MTEDDDATETSVVTTYVPAYQKDIWQDHAEDLDMSQSEFVKTMVQAGRRGFGGSTKPGDSGAPSSAPDPQGSDGQEGENDDLKRTVLEALDSNPHMSWDELVEAVIGDLEAELEETLTELQRTNRITHSPREGGYVLTED